MNKVTSTITLSDDTVPKNFDPASNAWSVELRHRGRHMKTKFYTGSALGKPTTADVMESLIMDASSIGWDDKHSARQDFEEWAEECGYDTDSRTAEQTYREIVKQTDQLIKLLGSEVVTELVWSIDPEQSAKKLT